MSQQTKDEKEYLDPELFNILQEVKGAIERGDLDEDAMDPMQEEDFKAVPVVETMASQSKSIASDKDV